MYFGLHVLYKPIFTRTDISAIVDQFDILMCSYFHDFNCTCTHINGNYTEWKYLRGHNPKFTKIKPPQKIQLIQYRIDFDGCNSYLTLW